MSKLKYSKEDLISFGKYILSADRYALTIANASDPTDVGEEEFKIWKKHYR